MLQFRSDKSQNISLTGLKDYAPCIFYFTVEDGGSLTLDSNTPISMSAPIANTYTETKASMQIAKKGSYQLVWTTKDGAQILKIIPVT